ncbi:MAG TPA: hypothetical protein VE338_13970, partial [Ktedonobacterales bacterium]|nr:hypothetical protein [Ktedonobacterales bacterium]
ATHLAGKRTPPPQQLYSVTRRFRAQSGAPPHCHGARPALVREGWQRQMAPMEITWRSARSAAEEIDEC